MDKKLGPCVICGEPGSSTLEHIIPQALLRRMGIEPATTANHPLTTSLCRSCNNATSKLHNNTALLDLIETGAPVSKEDLDALAHWIVWITLLLGVKRAGDVWPVEDARKQLKSRFRDGSTGGLPKGTRVFAALVDEDATGTLETTYAVLLKNDPRVRLDHKGLPAGFAPSGARTAAAVLRVGNLVVMVLAPTWSSGPGHNTRIDTAATEIGLTRIWPPTDPHIGLTPHTVALKEVWNLFACIPFEADNTDLLPPDIQEFVRSLTADPNPED